MIYPRKKNKGVLSPDGTSYFFVRRLDSALSAIAQGFLWIAALLMVVMVALMTTQVVLRYGFSSSLSWVEEVVRFLMIWMSFLGAAVVVWHRGHISVDIFVRYLPQTLQTTCRVISTICGIVFLVVLFFKGIEFLESVRITTAPATQISMDRVYIILPIGAFAMVIFLVRHLLADFGLLPPAVTKNPAESDHAN